MSALDFEEVFKMVKRCLVPSWNPNYCSRSGKSSSGKTQIFRFPADPGKCSTWLKAVPLKKKIDAQKSFLCERHWPVNYRTLSKKGRLRPRDPPSVWPDHPDILPTSCRPKLPPKPRETTRSSLTVRGAQPDELPLFKEQDRVTYVKIKARLSSPSGNFCCPTTSYEDNSSLFIQSKLSSKLSDENAS